MRRTVTGTISLSMLLAAPAVAQGNDCLAGLKMPPVGQWAEYQGTMSKKPYTMRYAVVGEEERDGKKLKWLELKMTGDKPERNSIFQVLTPGSPADMDQAEEAIMKSGGNPPMKIGSAMMGMIKGQLGKNSVFSNMCEGVTVAGEESVTVPAGTFTAIKYHNAKHNNDTWVVPDRPFVMVKSVGKNFEMSLTSSGGGATSSITETPKEMPGFGPSK